MRWAAVEAAQQRAQAQLPELERAPLHGPPPQCRNHPERADTAAAASVARRLTLNPRLAPGLYRITVRAQLDQNRLSRRLRRYLHVLG